MLNFNLRENKAFILPAFIFLMVFLVTVTFLKPKLSQIFIIRQEINSEKKQLASLTQKLASLDGLAQVELNEKTTLVLNALPAEKDVAKNLFIIKQLVQESDLGLNNVTIGDVGDISTASAQAKIEKGEVLPAMIFSVSVSGQMSKIGDFISKINSTLPVMKVNQIYLSNKKGDIPEVTLDINSYFLPIPKTLGKIDQAVAIINSKEEETFEKLKEFKVLDLQDSFYYSEGEKENPFVY